MRYNDSEGLLNGSDDQISPSPDVNEGTELAPDGATRKSLWDTVWRGPQRPIKPHVSMFFPTLQKFPTRLKAALKPWLKVVLATGALLFWFALNAALTRNGLFAISCDYKGDEGKCGAVRVLSCGITEDIWPGPGAECGLDGTYCMDDIIGETMAFRCPSNCEREGWVYEEWQVGADNALRVPLIVGGPDVYRGDSFICAAALHAGVISRYSGGCGKLEWVGPHTGFQAAPSADGRFTSLAFDSDFPVNFRFITDSDEKFTKCGDKRGIHVAVNVFFILMFSYFFTNPLLFLYSLITVGFWTVILASNPPWLGGSPEANNEIVSSGFRRFLPCLLAAVFIYVVATKPQLTNMPANLSRAVFWGGGFTIGILENFVFGAIPVDRLMISDLNAQPGAWVAVIIVSLLIICIAFTQAYVYWRKGSFPKYITVYMLGVFSLMLLSFWPNQTLRIHHYILALALCAGTNLKTTPSLFYQGLLVGLYVAGVARWDFDSILQTTLQLNRGMPVAHPDTDPYFIEPLSHTATSFVLQWKGKLTDNYNGYSLTINDVERYRGSASTFNFTEWALNFYKRTDADDLSLPTKWYFRVSSAGIGRRWLSFTGKVSEAMVFFVDGNYTIPSRE